jgi:hypothetical protein
VPGCWHIIYFHPLEVLIQVLVFLWMICYQWSHTAPHVQPCWSAIPIKKQTKKMLMFILYPTAPGLPSFYVMTVLRSYWEITNQALYGLPVLTQCMRPCLWNRHYCFFILHLRTLKEKKTQKQRGLSSRTDYWANVQLRVVWLQRASS